LNRRPFVRVLLASAATAVAIALAGCDTDSPLTKSSLRAKQPIPDKMLAEIEKKDMTKESPILVRIFKEESELEVWKKTRDGRYALLKTYPICRWSGELGPKVKVGDRQAPEGFYTITPGQMNPNSSYYLAFNTGFPNAYDRAWGRTGSDLMVHGDCSSRGCYAMTDEQIGEIYALAREAFFGGQRSFQLEAFPFRMTPVNMARHRNNPNMPFWKMLKEGYDHFEVTRLEPKVDVCERRYVFDAGKPAGATTPISFSPAGKCPAYQVPADIVAAVTEKRQHDEAQFAELVSRGTPTVPVKTGTDGGMNKVYLAALQYQPGGETRTAAGTIPATVNPPRATQVAYSYDAATPERAAPVLSGPQSAPVMTTATVPSSGGLFARMARAVGMRTAAAPAATPAETSAASKPAARPRPKAVAALPTPNPEQHVAAASVKPHAKPAAHPAPAAQPELRGATAASQATSAPVATPASRPAPPITATAMAAPTGALHGAQPVLSVGSFESRWSGIR
jgi:murein L,D-transpeptidase YafK